MDSWVRIFSTINLAGAIHALIQALLLLLAKRGNRRANRIMAALLSVFALGMANGFSDILGLYEKWPFLAILMGPLILAYGPLFYFYVKAMALKSFRWKPSFVLHGLPFLIGALSYGAFWLSIKGGPGRTGILAFFNQNIKYIWVLITMAAIVQTVVYAILIVSLLREYSKKIKATYSTIDRINLAWLRQRLIVYLTIWAVVLVIIVMAGGQSIKLAAQIAFFLVALNTFSIGYRATLQPQALYGPFEEKQAARYERSTLTPENSKLYKSLLLEVMEREKPFLDPEITLPKLAERLSIPLAHLSRVINERLGNNFYEFINHYRVQDAQRRLALPESKQQKLIAVALDCGFNSVATFNREFKELTGRTPSEYRKNPTD